MTLEEYISKKKLADGTTLGLKTWESDLLCPGRRMYQIDLVDDCTTLRFPTNYEDFTKKQVTDIYSSIKSRVDLEKLIYNLD